MIEVGIASVEAVFDWRKWAEGRECMTYREAIVSGEKSLCEAGIADARNDAWLLLTMACKIDHTYYYMHIDEEMPRNCKD